MGHIHFGIPQDLALFLRQKFDLNTFVETGTNHATTSAWASQHFRTVYSVEGDDTLYRAAVTKHASQSNLHFVHGDSREHLPRLLKKLDGPAVLWLDAHWCGTGTFGAKAECPLLEELRAVNESSHPHAILIDDARLFLAPVPLPHKIDEWPDLAAVMAELSRVPRFTAVYEDVIVSVPVQWRSSLVEFLRRPKPIPATPKRKRSVARRLRGFVARKLKERMGITR